MNLLLTWAGSYQKEVLHHTKLNFEMPGQRLTEHRGSTRSWINWWEMKDIPAGMAGHRTDPASHGPGGFLPYSEFLTSRQKSPASSEKQQELHPSLASAPQRSRQHKPILPYPSALPQPFFITAVSPCEAQEASEPRSGSRGWCHILPGRDLLPNSCTAWLCCPSQEASGGVWRWVSWKYF